MTAKWNFDRKVHFAAMQSFYNGGFRDMKAYAILKKIDQWSAKILGWIMASMLLVQLVILFAGVIARYFFNSPFIWSDELASLLLVAITFLGGYSALVAGKLANVTMIVDRFSPNVQRVLITIRNLMIIALCIVISKNVIDMMGKPVIQKQVSSVLRMPMKYVYTVIPVSFIMMAFHSFVNTAGLWLRKFGEKEGAEE